MTTDDAIRKAAVDAVHDFLIECGLDEDEADTAAIRVEKAVRPLIDAALRERLATAIEAEGGAYPASHGRDEYGCRDACLECMCCAKCDEVDAYAAAARIVREVR